MLIYVLSHAHQKHTRSRERQVVLPSLAGYAISLVNTSSGVCYMETDAVNVVVQLVRRTENDRAISFSMF